MLTPLPKPRTSLRTAAVIAVFLVDSAHPCHADDSPWRDEPALVQPVSSAGASVTAEADRQRIIVTGGVSLAGKISDAVQVLDITPPAEPTAWQLAARLRHARFGHAQVTLRDGSVLVVGGQPRLFARPAEVLASCELIAPDGSEVTPAADLPVAMRTPTLHPLPDGRVLAVGERAACIYTPADDAWSRPIPLKDVRHTHAAATLHDGTLLIIGGVNVQTLVRIDPTTGRARGLRVWLDEPLDDLAAVSLGEVGGGEGGGGVWLLGGQRGGVEGRGDTTDATWLLTLDKAGGGTLSPGPPLEIEAGVADARVVRLPHDANAEADADAEQRWLLIGGESQRAGRDTELDQVRLLRAQRVEGAAPRLVITPMPSTRAPRDDAAAVVAGGRVWVIGGFITVPLGGLPLGSVESADAAAFDNRPSQTVDQLR